MHDLPDYAVNLRRLFGWHLQSSKEAAQAVGASENTVSGWLTGKRAPSKAYLRVLSEVYGVSPASVLGDADAFGLEVADPERSHAADARLAGEPDKEAWKAKLRESIAELPEHAANR